MIARFSSRGQVLPLSRRFYLARSAGQRARTLEEASTLLRSQGAYGRRLARWRGRWVFLREFLRTWVRVSIPR